jgi:hypothetical protein
VGDTLVIVAAKVIAIAIPPKSKCLFMNLLQ